MSPRRLVVAIVAAVTMLASGAYLFVYLYRWEWNRAMIAGIIFLATEVAVIGWQLNGRIAEVRRDVERNRAERIAGHLAQARNQPSTTFAWLSPRRAGTNVFVPILMGAGLILSGLAWLVERLARHTAGRWNDQSLARQLSKWSPPAAGFLDAADDPLRDLRGPQGGRY
jgi:hypothetical protein